jgi:hypothetical protein
LAAFEVPEVPGLGDVAFLVFDGPAFGLWSAVSFDFERFCCMTQFINNLSKEIIKFEIF